MKYTNEIIKLKNVSNLDIDVAVFHLVLSDLSEVKSIIENEIVDMWDSSSFGYTIDEVKKDIYKVISSKTDIQKHGICAEFFMHLLLRDLGYKQKCVFTNLEENSMKKGFDGFYELSNDFWIAESKCAITAVKHKDKIKEALDDIDTKVSTTTGNDPWKNAFHHMMMRQDCNNNNSLTKKVASLSKDFINKKPHNSSEFNLIPSSTLFINNNQNDEDIKKDIEKVISKRKIKAMNILCINNDIYEEFITYLKGE